ncbi:MAG: cupin domain-containing protein [Planctomycetes bacterium]|nr:cupin domain-containing protein [Planctomycetota bacterium]
MNSTRKLGLVALVAAAAVLPFLWSAQAPVAKPQTPKIVGATLMPVAELKWAPMPGLAGAEQSPLWGDSTKEGHGIFYRWPAGTKAPLHTHTFGDRGIVVSGTLVLAVDGAAPKKLAPGSYFSLAGGTKHTTAVDGDQPCVFFVQREGPFDAVMVQDASAKK